MAKTNKQKTRQTNKNTKSSLNTNTEDSFIELTNIRRYGSEEIIVLASLPFGRNLTQITKLINYIL